jgi:3',5'-cyclic AMP phosphodiesterase CpdA
MIRLAHISDLHLTAAGLPWQWRDWLNKRFFSWVNLRVLGRGLRFAQADRVLRRLAEDLAEHQVDRVIFSGDATALGFEAELSHTAELLTVDRLPGLAVPGNHDYCTPAVASSGAFERVFAPWQQGERVGGHTYPFAQRVGAVWLIGVNSSKGNRWFWDASGRTGRDQLERLRQLLRQLPAGPRILVTHYPICLASGRREGFSHGLNDLIETVAIAAEGGVCLWLHGHRHAFYWFQQPNLAPFPVICAGSTTQRGLWSYGEYMIDGNRLQGVRREYDPDGDVFRDAQRFELALHAPAPTV